MTTPNKQKALFLESKHGNFVVRETEIPKPGEGELLVKVKDTALNPVDWKIQKYGIFVETYPAILGFDIAGNVVEVGANVKGFSKGDRVFCQGSLNNRHAGYQQYAICTPDLTGKIPANMESIDAATIPLTLTTAWAGLYNKKPHGAGFDAPPDCPKGKLAKTPIVVLGAGTCVGQFVVQLAKLSGFSPIIVTASHAHIVHLKSLGATHVIERHDPLPSIISQIGKLTKEPIKFVYETVGSPELQQAGHDLLASGGTLVTVMPPSIPNKSEDRTVIQVVGIASMPHNHELVKHMYKALPELLGQEKIKPSPVESLPGGLAGIPEGLKRLERNEISGVKLVAHAQA